MRTVVVPVDVDPLNKYEEAQAKAKRMIMDRVEEHVIPHIVEKNTTREMRVALTTLYKGSSVQLKIP